MQFSNINENIFDSDIETAVRNKAINLKAEKTRNEFIVIVDEQSLIFSLTDKWTIVVMSLIVGDLLRSS